MNEDEIYNHVRYLIERGYIEEHQFEETVKKLKDINRSVGHDVPTSTDSRQP